MKTTNYTFNNIELSYIYPMDISFSIRFWLYLIPNVLSILCTIFVLYHLLSDRSLRQALHNHAIIILLFIGLIYELTSVPFMLQYFRLDGNWQISINFSRFWTFIDYLCFTTQLIGFSWASIERHILIFHNQWLITKKKRFLFHYLPLIAILIYCFIYYFDLELFPFCGDLHFPSPTNGVPVPCLLIHPILRLWETICHQIIPTFIIVISSLVLLLRILKQKARLNRSINWRKQRRMTIQLLSISALYLIFNFPRLLIQFLILIGLYTVTLNYFIYYTGLFVMYITFLFPFVCCGSMPELGKKLKKLFFCRKQQVIVPEYLSIHPMAKT